jgi:hypothetical protein
LSTFTVVVPVSRLSVHDLRLTPPCLGLDSLGYLVPTPWQVAILDGSVSTVITMDLVATLELKLTYCRGVAPCAKATFEMLNEMRKEVKSMPTAQTQHYSSAMKKNKRGPGCMLQKSWVMLDCKQLDALIARSFYSGGMQDHMHFKNSFFCFGAYPKMMIRFLVLFMRQCLMMCGGERWSMLLRLLLLSMT